MLLVHLFVNFARVNFCHFSLPLCVRGWLWVVIVSLPGPFYFIPHKPATNADSEVSHTGRPAPDVRDGGHGEVAAPPQGYTHTTE